MRVLVLGSAAGGGVPQWNCRCPVCALAWRDPSKVARRTQTSLAVSADGHAWVLLDAAPDLRQQIIDAPSLHPDGPGRHSPIAAVALTSGDVDHVAGLLCLREGHRFTVLGTAATLSNLSNSTIFDVLTASNVDRRRLAAEETVSLVGLTVTPFAVPGKVPLYREGGAVTVGDVTEDVIGLEVGDGRRHLAYVPGLARLPADLIVRLCGADVLFLDGTTFTDDEMPRLGLASKTAGRMGHLAMTGEGGSLGAFPHDASVRKIFIHVNNTNPALVEGSAERALVEGAGWEIAHDGMEVTL